MTPLGVPAKLTAVVVALSHRVWSAGLVTVGVGLTVMVKVWAVPVQVPATGVTVMVAVTGVEPVLAAVKADMLPLPLPSRPMDGVLFVQL